MIFDTIAAGSYGECPYAEITEKLEKLSQTINFGVLGSQILGETPSQYNPHTNQS